MERVDLFKEVILIFLACNSSLAGKSTSVGRIWFKKGIRGL
jgi:hypothetical protein